MKVTYVKRRLAVSADRQDFTVNKNKKILTLQRYLR
jgi:hypothetical protein